MLGASLDSVEEGFPWIRFGILATLVLLPLPIGWTVEGLTEEPRYVTDPRCASGGEHELVPVRFGHRYDIDPQERDGVVYRDGIPAYVHGGCAVDPELPTYCVRCRRRTLLPVESEYLSDYRP